MRWTPDTHDITFEIDGENISIVTCNEIYLGREPQDVFNEVKNEHIKINLSIEKEGIDVVNL